MSQGQPLAFFISKFTDPNYQSRISVGILNSEVELAYHLFFRLISVFSKIPHLLYTISLLNHTQTTLNKIQAIQIKIKTKLPDVDEIDISLSNHEQEIFGAAYAKNRIQQILFLFDGIHQIFHRFNFKQIESIDMFNNFMSLKTINGLGRLPYISVLLAINFKHE